MKSISAFSNILIHKNPVDMRKSINGLSVIVSEGLKLDLKSPSLFVFTNRRRTHMKILYFDKSGFALWLKRLESSKFSWPKNIDKDVVEISAEDMELLLDGVNVWTRFEKVDFEHVV
ncbi:MAG: IS66 family insertion sequence element accessory protein TnpB [Bdellovibrionales bacterium]|nr:IS66 family insertion sequence element accessory protein TnpB [Bdellovibrionales bacterium]